MRKWTSSRKRPYRDRAGIVSGAGEGLADNPDGNEERNLHAGLLHDYRVRSQVRILPGSALRTRSADAATLPETLNLS
jgi:hypothetical protein